MRGLRAGAIGGAATVAAMYLIAPLTGVRPLPDLLEEPVLGLLPSPVFGFLIDTLQHWGKVLEEAGLVVSMITGLAVLGSGIATSAPSCRSGRGSGFNRAPRAIVRTSSRIDIPLSGSAVRLGHAFLLSGIAFAGTRGIGRVEVSTDGGGSWNDAEILAPLSGLTWSAWRLPWTPVREAVHTLVVRAVDATGELQSGQARPSFPAVPTATTACESRSPSEKDERHVHMTLLWHPWRLCMAPESQMPSRASHRTALTA